MLNILMMSLLVGGALAPLTPNNAVYGTPPMYAEVYDSSFGATLDIETADIGNNLIEVNVGFSMKLGTFNMLKKEEELYFSFPYLNAVYKPNSYFDIHILNDDNSSVLPLTTINMTMFSLFGMTFPNLNNGYTNFLKGLTTQRSTIHWWFRYVAETPNNIVADYYNNFKFYNRLYPLEDYNEGYNKGYNDGVLNGYNEGYGNGKVDGLNEAQETAYNLGYNDGYNIGLNEDFDSYSWLTGIFGGFGAFFSIELLPNVSIGGILIMILVLTLLPFLIGLLKGGK